MLKIELLLRNSDLTLFVLRKSQEEANNKHQLIESSLKIQGDRQNKSNVIFPTKKKFKIFSIFSKIIQKNLFNSLLFLQGFLVNFCEFY
jgi:hypothetical protein